MNNQLSCRILLLLILFSGLTILACRQPQPEVERAFYHWKRVVRLSDQEKQFVESAGLDKLYIRFFDVDIEEGTGELLPKSVVRIDQHFEESLEIIPTIFITNRSLPELPDIDLDSLAQRILHKIKVLWWEQLPAKSLKEIQIDCDWSGQTRERYFKLLRYLKEDLSADHIQLSVTIRLHQLKYPDRTGIPPADRGMLMFYNMGALEDPDCFNSILDTLIGKQYLQPSGTYPLPMDIALPVFSWGVLFRDGRMIKLINNLKAESLEQDNRFDKIGENRYQVNQSTYLNAYYLYEGDWIRCEVVGYPELKASAKLLKPFTDRNSFTISFYHLDTATLNNYTHEDLETIYRYFETPSH